MRLLIRGLAARRKSGYRMMGGPVPCSGTRATLAREGEYWDSQGSPQSLVSRSNVMAVM